MRLLARLRLRLPVVAVAFLAMAGCGRPETAADRHAAEMRDAIGKLEVERDRSTARVPLDDRAEDRRAGPPPARPPATPLAAPRAVQIGDDDLAARAGDDPNDPAARPEIRVHGSGGAVRPARGKSTTRRPEADEAPASRPDTARAPILDPEAKRSYEAALALVHQRQYDRALEALAEFVARWPDHPYAENATYWRGEAYFGRGEYLRAAEQFEAALTRYTGNKAPDALLKIGMCHERLGAVDRAREYWDRLRREYPRSDAARKAPGAPPKGAAPNANPGPP